VRDIDSSRSKRSDGHSIILDSQTGASSGTMRPRCTQRTPSELKLMVARRLCSCLTV